MGARARKEVLVGVRVASENGAQSNGDARGHSESEGSRRVAPRQRLWGEVSEGHGGFGRGRRSPIVLFRFRRC